MSLSVAKTEHSRHSVKRDAAAMQIKSASCQQYYLLKKYSK